MSERTPPPDADARQRIATDLDTTLFVEAGAGAGKTSALVGRIVALVEQGVPIGSIAAITFTEKAAAELRTRLREELEELALRHADVAHTALDDLDRAPIGTLHGFARRILFEFPIEAGLPPGFTVLDEVESGVEFDEQWTDLLARLLDEPSPGGGMLAGGEDFVRLCQLDGVSIDRSLRSIAEDFQANWDLVDRLVDTSDPGPLDIDLGAAIALAGQIVATPVPADDLRQSNAVEQVRTFLDRAQRAATLGARLTLLPATDDTFDKWAEKGTDRLGNKANWKRGGFSDTDLAALRQLEHEFGVALTAVAHDVRTYRERLIGAVLGTFVLDAARRRAHQGRLEFHDLLVLSRVLLTTRPDVRRMLHGRYRRVLLDEFQDTDPIQLEIAVRLTADPDDPAQDPRHSDWTAIRPLPGRLFIVGDPKQSIYRFRRADIAQYMRSAEQVGAADVTLSANFRSTEAVITFVNDVFGRLIVQAPEIQPPFTRLDACRPGGLLGHGTVHVIGAEAHDDLADWKQADHDGVGAADELRRREAVDVARAISTALAEGWPIGERSDDGANGTLRRCRPGDICVLLPTRLPLPALERELAAAGIPYRAENSSVVYATTEVRHLLGVLRAADDPTDALALVAALRSPLYGCSDVELLEWKRGGGGWWPWQEPPEALVDHPVAAAIAHIRSIAERSGWVPPADLLAAIADERRAFDLALDGSDGRDVWRRLRFVIDQARAWADAGGHGVRRYLSWAELQASQSRVADTILPEHDHDAVRVMTIHAAKGLQFPITIVAGMTTKPKRLRNDRVLWLSDGWKLTGRAGDGSYEAHQPIDETMSDAERRRLLYVACTRAVDHLVVSTHREPFDPAIGGDKLTAAALMWSGGAADASSGARVEPFELHPVATTDTSPIELEWDDVETWAAERRRAMQAAGRRRAIAATRLAQEIAEEQGVGRTDTLGIDDPGLDKQPVNIVLPSWQRGRYGTSIGRAVHGVLQFCDLSTGDDIDNLAQAQCAAEGVLGLQSQVAALARSALAAPIVRQVAAGAEHRRELFVAAPVGDRVLEGYVDLLVRTADGLVIVDYKTDQWSGPVQTAERVGRYRIQLAAYAAALQAVIGEPIVSGVLVRCVAGKPAEEIVVADWPAAIAEVGRIVSGVTA